VTEYRHPFLLVSNEFHENRMSESQTLLVGQMNLCLYFLRVSADKKSFAGDVHKNVFSGCNVPENRYNEPHIWRGEV